MLGQQPSEKIFQIVEKYYAYKAAKDYLLLFNQELFTQEEIKQMFDDYSLENYLNDVAMHHLDLYIQMSKNITFDETELMRKDKDI